MDYYLLVPYGTYDVPYCNTPVLYSSKHHTVDREETQTLVPKAVFNKFQLSPKKVVVAF